MRAPLSVLGALVLVSGCLDQPFATNVDLPLQVIALSPSDGATSVRRDAPIVVTFNLEVVPDSATTTTALVVEDVSDPENPIAIEGERTYSPGQGGDPPQLKFTPATLLPYSSSLRVRVTPEVRRAAGQGIPEGTLLKEVSATFRTVEPPALRLVSASPSADAQGVSRASAIELVFSEPVSCESVQAGLRVVEHLDAHPRIGGGTRDVSGALQCPEPPDAAIAEDEISCDAGACVIVFVPDDALEYSSRVEVTVQGGTREDGAVESFRATDAGGQLPETVTWSFETMHPAPLAISSVSPAAGAEEVALDAPIEITFSEPVRCSTIEAVLSVVETLDPDVGGTSADVEGTLACAEPASIEDTACDGGACTVTFTPDQPFELSSTITVSLAGGAHPDAAESFRATTRGGQLPSDASWTFVAQDPPALTLVSSSPGNGATQVPPDTGLSLTFSEEVDCASIQAAIDDGSLAVVETLDDGSAGAGHAVSLASCAGNIAELAFSPAFSLSATVDVAIPETLRSARATSQGGNLIGGALISFQIEHPPELRVISTLPGNGAIGVRVDTSILVQLSEEVDCASVDVGAISVVETLDAETAAAVGAATLDHPVTLASCGGNQLELTTANDFQLSSTVQVTLPGTIRSARATLSGGYLEGGAGYVLGFDTSDPPDLLVVFTSPGDRNTLVPVDEPIVATFSEALDLSSVGDLTFVVEQLHADGSTTEISLGCGTAADGAAAGTACSYVPADADHTVVFTPPAALEYDTEYRFTLTTGIESARANSAGGSLAVTLTYTFKTIASPPIEVVSLVPAPGVVDVRPTFRVVFNQDIFPPVIDGAAADLDIFLSPVAAPGDTPDPAQRVALDCANCNNADSSYELSPQADLFEGQRYVLVIRGDLDGVRGVSGGAILLADYSQEYIASGGALLVYTEPADGDVDVSVAQRVCAVFLEDIDPATVDAASFHVEAENDLGLRTELSLDRFDFEGVDPLTGEPDASFTSNRVCFVPAPAVYPCRDIEELLPADTTIFVTLGTAITSTDGTAMGAAVPYAFLTGSLPTLEELGYDALPFIGVSGPIAGAAEIPTTATLRLELSEEVDAASLTASVSLVGLDDGSSVPAELALEDGGLRVRVTPTANLAFADDLPAGYALRVVGGALGLRFTDGRYLGGHADVAFVTSPKTLVEVSPPQGDLGFEAMQNPVTFTRAMYLPSLNTDTIYAEVGGARLSATVGTNADDVDAATYVAVPTYQDGTNVTLTVTAAAMDYLGNPLPAETVVTYVGIQNAPALAARVPNTIAAGNVSPNAGAVRGDQVFTLTLPAPGAQLQNRMLPNTFNDASIVITDLDGCHGGGQLAQTNEYDVGASGAADVVTFRAAPLLRAGCDYEVRLRQSLFANIYTASNTGADVVFSVTGEQDAPTLASSVPADTSTVSADTPVVLTFSEEMDPASFGPGSVLLDGGALAGEVEVDGAIVTFVPDAPIPAGAHTLDVAATVTDLAGNAFAGATVSFTVENVAPTVVSVTAPSLDRIEVLFDEKVDAATVRPDTASLVGTVRVETVDTEPVTVYGCLELDETGTRAVFVPLSPLASGATYRITVTTGVTDLGGTPLAADHVEDATAP